MPLLQLTETFFPWILLMTSESAEVNVINQCGWWFSKSRSIHPTLLPDECYYVLNLIMSEQTWLCRKECGYRYIIRFHAVVWFTCGVMQEINRSELERLDRERHDDFLSMLKGFVVNQVFLFPNNIAQTSTATFWTKCLNSFSYYFILAIHRATALSFFPFLLCLFRGLASKNLSIFYQSWFFFLLNLSCYWSKDTGHMPLCFHQYIENVLNSSLLYIFSISIGLRA